MSEGGGGLRVYERGVKQILWIVLLKVSKRKWMLSASVPFRYKKVTKSFLTPSNFGRALWIKVSSIKRH